MNGKRRNVKPKLFAEEPRRLAREAMAKRGLTQQQVRRQIGCSVGFLSLYLSGKRRLSPEMAKRVGKVIGVTPAQLLDWGP